MMVKLGDLRASFQSVHEINDGWLQPIKDIAKDNRKRPGYIDRSLCTTGDVDLIIFDNTL